MGCKTPFQNAFPLDAEGLCALCRAGARGFERAYCFGAYEGNLRELVHLLKYAGVRTLAAPLGEVLRRAIPLDQPFDAVVPMPLHWKRQWRRGYNQSTLLARAVAKHRGIPVLDAIRRVRDTRSQTGLTNAQRRENMVGAFRMRRQPDVRGLRILLIDDVMTTGATGSSCASVLTRAGARSVTLLTLARVDRRSEVPAAARPQSHAVGAS